MVKGWQAMRSSQNKRKKRKGTHVRNAARYSLSKKTSKCTHLCIPKMTFGGAAIARRNSKVGPSTRGIDDLFENEMNYGNFRSEWIETAHCVPFQREAIWMWPVSQTICQKGKPSTSFGATHGQKSCEKIQMHKVPENVRFSSLLRTIWKITISIFCLSYVSSFKLEIHSRLHSGMRPFQCPECKKSFHSSPNLRSHQLTHDDEKRFVCDICKKGFKHASTLTTHTRWVSLMLPIGAMSNENPLPTEPSTLAKGPTSANCVQCRFTIPANWVVINRSTINPRLQLGNMGLASGEFPRKIE